MTKNSTLSFVISQEELAVLLVYLKTKSIVGLDPLIFKGLGKKQLQMALGVAERSLIARGFLIRGNDALLKIEPLIFATVGACAFPESTILLTNSRPNTADGNYYFHTSRKMFVMHTVPMTAMHQFIAVEDRITLKKAVFSILRLDAAPSNSYPEGKITRLILNQAREVTQKNGRKSALSILTAQGGLDEEAARAFAETLERPVSNTMIAYVEKQGKHMEGCSILQGEKDLWWISPIDDKNDERAMVSIKSVSIEEIRKQAISLLRL